MTRCWRRPRRRLPQPARRPSGRALDPALRSASVRAAVRAFRSWSPTMSDRKARKGTQVKGTWLLTAVLVAVSVSTASADQAAFAALVKTLDPVLGYWSFEGNYK